MRKKVWQIKYNGYETGSVASAVNSANQWIHTLKVYAAENEIIYLNGTSKVSVSGQRVFICDFPNIVCSTPLAKLQGKAKSLQLYQNEPPPRMFFVNFLKNEKHKPEKCIWRSSVSLSSTEVIKSQCPQLNKIWTPSQMCHKNFLKLHKGTGEKMFAKYLSADDYFLKTALILLTVNDSTF